MKKLNFGCGADIRKGWDNCDVQKGDGVISFDANKFPYPFKDDTYDYILLREVLYCLYEPDKAIYELRRIAKHGAIIEIRVPYYNNKGAHNDLQVKHYYNDTVFKIFAEQPCVIKKEKKFEIYSSKLNPTIVGKFIPESLRNKLALFIGGIISTVNVKLKVIKKNVKRN